MGGVELSRERDPLRKLRFFQDPLPSIGDWEERRDAIRRTNHAISVIQLLNSGTVKGVARRPFRYRGNQPLVGHSVEKEVADDLLSKISARPPPAGRLTGFAAFRALLGIERLPRGAKTSG